MPPKKPVYLAIYELYSRVTSQRSPNLNRFETSSSLNANKMFQNVFPYRRFSCFTITRLHFTCFNQARSCTWYSFIKDWIEHEFIDEPLGPDATTRGFDSITPRLLLIWRNKDAYFKPAPFLKFQYKWSKKTPLKMIF